MAKKKRIYRFTGKEGKFMPEAQLKKWIQNHETHNEIKGHFVGREIITNILSHPDCMGIRVYYAINDKGDKTLVVVGSDAKGKDIWPSTSGGKLKGSGGGGGDQLYPCPPYCS
jgi:hypothetical protein